MCGEKGFIDSPFDVCFLGKNKAGNNPALLEV